MHQLLQSDSNLSPDPPPRTSGELDEAMMRLFRMALNNLIFYLRNPSEKMAASNGTEEAPHSLRELTEIALREATVVSGLMSRLEQDAKAPAGELISFVRGSAALDAGESSIKSNSTGYDASRAWSSRRNVLSPREREVLALVVGGSSSRVGAPQLGISIRTFEVHRAKIMKKLGAKNTADLVRLALNKS